MDTATFQKMLIDMETKILNKIDPSCESLNKRISKQEEQVIELQVNQEQLEERTNKMEKITDSNSEAIKDIEMKLNNIERNRNLDIQRMNDVEKEIEDHESSIKKIATLEKDIEKIKELTKKSYEEEVYNGSGKQSNSKMNQLVIRGKTC